MKERKGTLKIEYKQKGQQQELVLEVPREADEATVLLYILSNSTEPRIAVDVYPGSSGVDRLRPQIEAIGISDIKWEFKETP